MTLHTKEYQFQDSMPTQENVKLTDPNLDNVPDLLDDDAKYLDPIAKVSDLGRGLQLSDIKWVMNDLLFMVTTADG